MEYCLEYLGHLQCTSARKQAKGLTSNEIVALYVSGRAVPKVGAKGFDESLPLGLVA